VADPAGVEDFQTALADACVSDGVPVTNGSLGFDKWAVQVENRPFCQRNLIRT
jgi:hypothetical protein